MTLNIKFCASVLELHLPEIFCHRHTQIVRHFLEIVKSCPGHPKTSKSIKNWKSKICTKSKEESKKYLEKKFSLIMKKIKFSNFIIPLLKSSKFSIQSICILSKQPLFSAVFFIVELKEWEQKNHSLVSFVIFFMCIISKKNSYLDMQMIFSSCSFQIWLF